MRLYLDDRVVPGAAARNRSGANHQYPQPTRIDVAAHLARPYLKGLIRCTEVQVPSTARRADREGSWQSMP